jgi:hypothetical protein
MEKALQEIFPLLLFDKRIWLFGVNLVPPESDDENENIISYFAGAKTLNFVSLPNPFFPAAWAPPFSLRTLVGKGVLLLKNWG